MGSSPRVRGKRASLARIPAPIRLIPARAGKINPTDNRNRASRAHPRVCGENKVAIHGVLDAIGSSPRVRGKRIFLELSIFEHGLIPAHAGKTFLETPVVGLSWAHPRACGENGVRGCRALAESGSSPRMRGKHLWRAPDHPGRRLIPAHAGKTSQDALPVSIFKAHPRACGENRLSSCMLGGGAGSSPRMRGKPRQPSADRLSTGLIPAHAGKTLCPSSK